MITNAQIEKGRESKKDKTDTETYTEKRQLRNEQRKLVNDKKQNRVRNIQRDTNKIGKN